MTTAGYEKLKAALNAQLQLVERSPEAAAALLDHLRIRDIFVPATKSSEKKIVSPRKV